jgi:hypothetical protein
MTVFSTAFDTLFNDPNMAVSAMFVPLQGVSKAVSVVTRAPDVFQAVGQSMIETPSMVLEVRVADCPALVQGDQFIINAVAYTIQGEPRRDSEHLAWQVDVYAA